MSTLPNYHCPGCGQLSGLVIGKTQALCTNTDDNACNVIMFNPDLPDGGMSDAQIVDGVRRGDE